MLFLVMFNFQNRSSTVTLRLHFSRVQVPYIHTYIYIFFTCVARSLARRSDRPGSRFATGTQVEHHRLSLANWYLFVYTVWLITE